MATIYKRKRDQGRKNVAYWIQYVDHDGRRRTKKGFSDKGLTEQLAGKLENEAMLRRQGLIDPAEESASEWKTTPLDGHLTAFEKSVGRKDNTAKHVRLTMSRVRRIVNEADMRTAADIDVESVQETLAEIMEAEGIGHRTYNHYVQSMDQFCRWLVRTKRIPRNPIADVDRLNTEVDVRHPRRALEPDEFTKLVESARSSGIEIQHYDGDQRARIYILSYMTGLRRKELAGLTPNSFDLDGMPATVTVEAACSKHRRKDVLPLHPDLVAMLRCWLAEIEPGDVLFPKLAKRRTWFMVRKDLERAGIPYETKDGIADFHATGRHTHITGLLRNGASLPEARELARHSDIKMTMKYTHIGMDDQVKAVARLPADKKWLHIGCIPRVSDCHNMSPGDSGEAGGDEEPPKTNPCQSRGLVTEKQRLSADVAAGESGGGGNRTRVP